jgi:hypothetical protein
MLTKEELFTLTNKQLKNYAKQTMETIGVCDSIMTLHPDARVLFSFLIKRHSQYGKTAKFDDMADIKIRKSRFGHLEGRLVYEDGSEDGVSFLNDCITNYKTPDIHGVMRNEIENQIITFKSNAEQVCVICSATENMHVDHDNPSFKYIMATFLNDNKPVPSSFDKADSNLLYMKEEDAEYRTKWQAYHEEHALLQMLCMSCNLKKH